MTIGFYHFGSWKVAYKNVYCTTCQFPQIAVGKRSILVLHLFFIPILPIGFRTRWYCLKEGHNISEKRPSRKWILNLGTASKLRHLRVNVYKYTQSGMAKVIGLSPETYRKFECEQRIPGTSSALVLELFIGDPDLVRHASPRLWTRENILRLRGELNMSQAAFAMLLNVTSDSIKKWESGIRKPSRAAAILLEILASEPESAIYKIVESARQSAEAARLPTNLHRRSKIRHEGPRARDDQLMLALA